ncbi:MAG: tetratricopeptide repeat protein [Acidithiobacillus ferrooxidans]
MTPPLDNLTIRTPTAAMLAGVTTRSILRWIEDGTMTGEQCAGRRGATDLVWKVALDSLKGRIPLTLDGQIVQHIIHADEGDPAAKNALGLSFYAAGQYSIAAGWFEAAARQGHVDAMDWLGNCYLKGQGVSRDKALGLKWLSEAAAHGHSIAQHRVDALLPG